VTVPVEANAQKSIHSKGDHGFLPRLVLRSITCKTNAS
jgi:hypothetical protein